MMRTQPEPNCCAISGSASRPTAAMTKRKSLFFMV
jgi:hypothetical protein